MNGFIVGLAGILVITFAEVSSAQSQEGTCASIGYSTSCCPPDQTCQASDGDTPCFCGSDCHIFGDCCSDVFCPENPRTCLDVGITSCCNDISHNGLCDVHFRDIPNRHCSCNVTCHRRNDCCSDAVALCIPRTCTEIGKDPGCCVWSSTSSCFVPGGRCYCDSYCTFYNDCCSDVPSNVNYQYCIGNQQDRSRVQSDLEQDLKASTMVRYNDKNHRFRTQNGKIQQAAFRQPQTARAQRPRMRPREYYFRARGSSQRG